MLWSRMEYAASGLLLLAATQALPTAASAGAASVADPLGDFLDTYVGPENADLDFVQATAGRTAKGVYLSATFAAAPGSATPGGTALWGVDRGAGFPGLILFGPPAVGTPDMLLDAVVAMNFNGTGRIRTFLNGVPTDTLLAPGTVHIDGNSISAFIHFDLLPSTGFASADYSYVSWSRAQLGSQSFIADLAPETASFKAGVVPEPAAWALFVTGFGAIGGMLRRRAVLRPA